jgi:hypothetical protein
MFDFWSRGPRTIETDVETADETKLASETETTPPTEYTAVEEAIRIIQKHVDKEARNRWVEHLEVRDLCPRQKADLVADLVRTLE